MSNLYLIRLFALGSFPLYVLLCAGCSVSDQREQADTSAYSVIENASSERGISGFVISSDHRSRFYDPSNPDEMPMPTDDPASGQLMKSVYGMDGWDSWSKNGANREYENPGWRDLLPSHTATNETGAIVLDVDAALRLAYVHSPSYQTQVETLYLSALDVTAQRFRFDTQYFGGYDIAYRHRGTINPAGFGVDPATGNTITTPASHGRESNRLTLGSNPTAQFRRKFSTAGEIVAGFANSFVFEFTGNDANLASSLANFSVVQPLLRGAGRHIALEDLTQSERNLLANVRAHRQFRQGFYTNVAIGESGVAGSRRGSPSTSVNSYAGFGGVGGFLGLLQQMQQIRNTEDNLSRQLRTLDQLEALLDFGIIDIDQVDQFRQSVQRERASLLQSQNNLELSLDQFKTGTLGLPPDLEIEMDESFIEQFQFVTRSGTNVEDAILSVQDNVGLLPEDLDLEALQPTITELSSLAQLVRKQLDDVARDLGRLDEATDARTASMDDPEVTVFLALKDDLRSTLDTLNLNFETVSDDLSQLRDDLPTATSEQSLRNVIIWLGDLLRLTQRSVLVQARARLETVTVERIELASTDAVQIALHHRLDFMNARAALVDDWRQIQISQNQLQSVLNITAGGDVYTARNNPVSFRAPTGSLRLGLEFDAPFTRLIERNAYRETLIRYQQSRRRFIQSQDRLNLGLRALIRQIQQLRNNQDIQRRAVAIAIRRVDSTRANLYAPVPARQPGQRVAQFGPTSAINLLSSLSSLRDTQNSFLSAWLSYYAAKMRLVRELGIMELDDKGNWVDQPLPPLANMLPEDIISPGEDSSPETKIPTTIAKRFHDRILTLQTKIENIISARNDLND
ncbi:MAG: TolC family protein [Planctomycetota bacterium]|nr:TolC family protein [Planctomycetota bacterium]